MERSIDCVRKVARVAEGYGVIYALDVVNRLEQWLANDAKAALAFCEAVGNPSCKVQLDTFHRNIEEGSFREAILRCKGHLGHFSPRRDQPAPARAGTPAVGRDLRRAVRWDHRDGALRPAGRVRAP